MRLLPFFLPCLWLILLFLGDCDFDLDLLLPIVNHIGCIGRGPRAIALDHCSHFLPVNNFSVVSRWVGRLGFVCHSYIFIGLGSSSLSRCLGFFVTLSLPLSQLFRLETLCCEVLFNSLRLVLIHPFNLGLVFFVFNIIVAMKVIIEIDDLAK